MSSLLIPIISKLSSESLLSLYPVFVKNINLPISIQLESRLLIYVIISLIFCNIPFIKKNIFTYYGLLLGFTNLIHIYTSYRGFQLLESGVSYTLFYTYPIMIILLSGLPFQLKTIFIILIALLGVYLISYDEFKSIQNHENFLEKKNENEIENELKEKFPYEGFTMIFFAALTEALIYFQVRNIKTDNNWNHVFIAYFLGMVIMSIYLIFTEKKEIIQDKELIKRFSIAILINAVIGSLGYFLRFFAATRLKPVLYAILSYFGIFMSFIYGIFFNKDKITIKKIIGALLIIISNFFLIQSIE
jgi:drug/metabolite transporter (DMT)-like permease